MKLIGISGKVGTGKTTLGCYFENVFEFKHTYFAYAIKEMVALLTGTTFEDNMKKKSLKPKGFKDKTLGELQVEMGEDYRKKYGKEVWTHSVNRFIEKWNGNPIVVSDVRTKVEAEFLRKKGGVIIRLEREFEKRKKFLCGRDPNSEIECDLDDYEHFEKVLKNNGTKEDLFKNIVNYFTSKMNPSFFKPHFTYNYSGHITGYFIPFKDKKTGKIVWLDATNIWLKSKKIF
jgi:dephospho-CoA kinase